MITPDKTLKALFKIDGTLTLGASRQLPIVVCDY